MTGHTPPIWRFAGSEITLDRARFIIICNATPDSFSDGGRYLDPAAAVALIRRAITEGADIIDVGGESTRPGAERIDPDEQIRRVIPVIEAVRAAGVDRPISIDTTRTAVAAAALDAGATIINDVSGGAEDQAMLPLAAERSAGLILMHRLRVPGEDVYSHQYDTPPDYGGDVVTAVRDALAAMVDAAGAAGVAREAIVVDPGLGFGKSVEQNLALIRGTRALASIGRPLLSAASRKSFLGALTGESDPARRDPASVGVSAEHYLRGVRLFRVHEVRPHADAIKVLEALAGDSPAVARGGGRC